MILCGMNWGLTIAFLLVTVVYWLLRFGWIVFGICGVVLLCDKKSRGLGVVLLVLLIAAAVVVALRERQPVSKPEAPLAKTLAEVRVKAGECKSATVIQKGLFVNSYVDGLVDKCKKEAKYE